MVLSQLNWQYSPKEHRLTKIPIPGTRNTLPLKLLTKEVQETPSHIGHGYCHWLPPEDKVSPDFWRHKTWRIEWIWPESLTLRTQLLKKVLCQLSGEGSNPEDQLSQKVLCVLPGEGSNQCYCCLSDLSLWVQWAKPSHSRAWLEHYLS